MVICSSSAVIYSEPDFMSEQADEMLYGEEAEILEESGIFCRIISEYGYTGWTVKTNLFCKTNEPNYTVSSSFADLLLEGRYHYEPYMALPRGAKVCAEFTEKSPRFGFVSHPNEFTFYIRKSHLSPIADVCESVEEKRKRITATAKEYTGVQYRWGGRTHHGIDCSGLCFNAYKFNGITVWRDADAEKSASLKKIPFGEAKSADLLFFENHVAMYLGNGEIIHSSAEKGCVTIESLNGNEALKKKFITAGTAF